MKKTATLRKAFLLLVAGGLLSVFAVAFAAKAKPGHSADRARSIGERLQYQPTPDVPPELPATLGALAKGVVVELSPAASEVGPFDGDDGVVLGRLFLVSGSGSPKIPEGEYYLWMGGSRGSPRAELLGVHAGAAVPITVYESAAAAGAIWIVKDELNGETVSKHLSVRYCFRVNASDASGVGYCVEFPAN